MNREVRRVPKNWKHPKKADGSYIPLYAGGFELCALEWDKDKKEWEAGDFPEYVSEESKKLSFIEFEGERPNKKDFMPTFKQGEATYYMMYETTSEGTPISPAFETPEKLARWLTDNKASAFGNQTMGYEDWLRVARGSSLLELL